MAMTPEPDPDPPAMRLDRLVRRQRGLLVTTDLTTVGLSRRQVERRKASGQLIPVRRGVYRLPGVAGSWEQALLAAVMVAPAGSAASHLAAARLHHLRGIASEQLEITSPNQCRLDGVRVHRSVHLPAADVTRIHSIAVTTTARTLCDLAGLVPISALGRALDECLRGALTLTALERSATRLADAGGRHRLAPILELLAARRTGPELGDSVLEGRVLAWLREADLPDPVTQYRFRRGKRPDDRIDLAYPDLKIAIELSGWYEHGKREALEHDQSRRNRHEVAGWMVLEFADRHSRSEVLETVTRAREAQLRRLSGLAQSDGWNAGETGATDLAIPPLVETASCA